MSLSPDVLSKSTPTRLVCHGGRWVLELTRLEAVDRDVFQPRMQRLEGPDSILALLRRSDQGQSLASAAAQLMRGPRVDEDRAFDANEGDWVPAAEVPAFWQASSREEQGNADSARLLQELRAELFVLRASHLRLRERVAALEAQQGGIPQANLRIPRGSRARRRSEPPPPAGFVTAPTPPTAAGAAGASPFAATQASPGFQAAAVAPVFEPPAQAPRAGADAGAGPGTLEELAKSLAGDQLPPLLQIPSLRALQDCMDTLMSPAPSLTAAQRPFELGELQQARGCKLLDEEGRERGIILTDLRAAVLLGAGLIALPSDDAERQVADLSPSEDALLAMSEICNNFTAPVNAVPGNAHIRSTALSSVEPAELPQLRARLDLAVAGGALIFAMF